MTDEEKKQSIDDKLSKVKYIPDEETHLKPDEMQCSLCISKACTYICPAHVYEWDEENQKLIIGHENCLECGACRVACEKKCIIWNYPKGNKGVTFKLG
ncbi:MAG: 4Fe-4S dicluster domain-containing protein [Candidatus Gastranaerophilales bacterium]|nr:4Fe-4S dicluster domain-containing protein [Candidatus Gastranaerophilales bacterium]